MLFFCAALTAMGSFGQESGLLSNIITSDRSVWPNAPSLTGTWVGQNRRAAPPGTAVPPAAAVLLVFHADGSVTGSSSGSDSSFSGVWLRVAERKFLVTYYALNYNESRTVVSIAKVRMTTQLDADGRTILGSQEVLVVDPERKVLFTALGGTHTMVRAVAERPTDFDAFLRRE
jgi:hypothetical protein